MTPSNDWTQDHKFMADSMAFTIGDLDVDAFITRTLEQVRDAYAGLSRESAHSVTVRRLLGVTKLERLDKDTQREFDIAFNHEWARMEKLNRMEARR